MVTRHSENVRTLTRLARTAEDEDVRAYAKKTLGTIKQHQAQAKDIRVRLSLGVGAG